MPGWYADKGVLLSTSMYESFGLNIGEAMAVGAFPVVHDFPGADRLWPEECLFASIDDAVALIRSSSAGALSRLGRGPVWIGPAAGRGAAITGRSEMMRVIAVGRSRDGPEAELFARYSARIRPALALTEIADGKGSPAEIKRREGEALLAALPAQTFTIALDLDGEMLDSAAFATRLEGWLALSRPICFLIGGAEGLDRPVLARCRLYLVSWADDLAASAGARDAGRANLSRTIDHRRPPVSPFRAAGLIRALFDRHENRMPHLAADRLRQMALAADVLDEDDLAGADLPSLAVAGGDLHAAVQIDDVLAARRRMPGQIVIPRRLAENDAGGRQAARIACCRSAPRPI